MTINQRTPSLRFQAHLAFTRGLPSVQKCQKSLQARPAPTHGQENIAAKIRNDNNEMINGQLVTGGHKTLGVKWLNEHSVSHQAFFSVENEVAPNSPNDFIPPNVRANGMKTRIHKK